MDVDAMQVEEPMEITEISEELPKNLFGKPTTPEQQWGEDLVDKCIAVYWDGDNVYYPCTVTRYEVERDRFSVVYLNDSAGGEYAENLRKISWKLWRGSKEECSEFFRKTGWTSLPADEDAPVAVAPKPAKKTKLPTYSSMVLEAVIALNEKEGSSLNAIRKFLLIAYDIQNQHKASFNNLTLKAVNNLTASDVLEKVKHSFRLSAAEKERRRIQERVVESNERREGNMMPGTSRKYTPFIIDADSLHMVVSSNNKNLRKELLDLRDKRDRFLVKRLDILKPFLPSRNYFKRLLRDRENRRQAAVAARQSYLRQAEECFQAGIGYQIPPKHPDESIEELDPALKRYIEEADEVEESAPADETDAAIDAPENGEAPAAEKDTMDEEEATALPTGPEMSVMDTVADDTNAPYSTLEGVNIVQQPTTLTAALHEHQFMGISWMVHMFQNGMPMILGDQMGLGKTIQTIGFLAYLHEKLKKQGPHLIVVPLSVLSNWLSEIEKFCPSFRTVRFHGPKTERERIKEEEMRDLKEFDIVVTTYEILVSEINFFRRKYVWTTVVIDEGHRLKNDKSQFSEKLRCVPCVSKVILTGTPLQNNLRELWSMLFYLAPEIFTASEKFDEGFDLLRGKIDSNILRQARKMLSVFMLRRLKENVSIKLPSRKEVTLLVSLTQQQVDLYKQLLCGLDASTIEIVMREGTTTNSRASTEALTSLDTSTAADGSSSTEASTSTTTVTINATQQASSNPSTDSEWRKLMNILLQLRKICNHTYLLPNIAPEPYHVSEEIVSGSGKLLMLDRMLPALRADGHRVLLFSQFTSMLDILEDYCELRDYPFVRLDGETNRVKRRLDCRRFNAPNSPLFIFLISTRAGGLGLNLASADTVILYDSDWNPQVDLQAMERAHRIGQTKPVRVFRLVCRGSVEERMISRAEKKLFLNAMVAEIDPDEQLNEHGEKEASAGGDISDVMQALGIGGSSLSKGELASLIRFGANAVFEGENASQHHITDEELDRLLERKGRDLEVISVPLTGSVSAANAAAEAQAAKEEADAFEAAQASLKERVSSLKEVDLRQLGDVVYNKKKTSGRTSTINTSLIIEDDTKRERKERIVMVDGRGTGYGGAVPILSDNMQSSARDEDVDVVVAKTRGRQWKHRTFCTLCARAVKEDQPYHKCAHCPFVFHQPCGESHGLFYKGSGLLICPHHRCVDCCRPTASAGGLLFRCLGCLTSYCEDCLPQDEIESVGRCKSLEADGYISKQAYYIKCPRCCSLEGLRPQGVLGDRDYNEAQAAKTAAEAKAAEGSVNNDDTSSNNGGAGSVTATATVVEEDAPLPWATQMMRVHWTEIIDPPKPPKSAKKGKKGSKKRKRSCVSGESKRRGSSGDGNGKATEDMVSDEEEDNDDDDEDEAPAPKRFHIDLAAPEVPEACSLQLAMQIFVDHPATQMLAQMTRDLPTTQASHRIDDLSQEVSHIIGKVESGRYRSAAQFVRDLKYVVDGRLLLVANKAITAATSSLPERNAAGEDVKEQVRQFKEKATFLARALGAFLLDDLEGQLELE